MKTISKTLKRDIFKELKAGERRPPMPRPARFEDKTKYSRSREKRRYIADFD